MRFHEVFQNVSEDMFSPRYVMTLGDASVGPWLTLRVGSPVGGIDVGDLVGRDLELNRLSTGRLLVKGAYPKRMSAQAAGPLW